MMLYYYTAGILLLFIGYLLFSRSGYKAAGTSILLIGAFLIIAELLSLIVLKVNGGEWIYGRIINENSRLFQYNPHTVGSNKPDVKQDFNGTYIEHNSRGYRGPEIGEGKKGIKRVVCIGGSTTYGVSVDNHETWPYYLDSLLGYEYEVINLAVPGHSSVEHIVTASLDFPKLHPDYVLIHAGINDWRNSNVKVNGNVYTQFHGPSAYGSLGLCPKEKLPNLAIVHLLVNGLQYLNYYPVCPAHTANFDGEVTNDIDFEVMESYGINLRIILEISKLNNTESIFLPQVLVKESFHDDNYKWWAPYISSDAIIRTNTAFNNTMKNLAREQHVTYLTSLLDHNWSVNDFNDPSHLNSKANLIFAQIIADHFKQQRSNESKE